MSSTKHVLDTLQKITSGEVKIGKTRAWTYSVMGAKAAARISSWDEILCWELYRKWADPIEPNCRFDRAGVSNFSEYKRRRFMMGMFFLIEFRFQEPRCKELFQKSFGSLSLREFMTVCGVRVPNFYYEWAFETLPVSKVLFGPGVLEVFAQSPDHIRTFKKLDTLKQDLLTVRRIHES